MCDYIATTKDSLKRHMLRYQNHEGTFGLNKIKYSLFKCNICKEEIPYMKLNKHAMKDHDGTCPYEYCNKSYEEQKSLSSHIFHIHRSSLFWCEFCPKSWKHKETLNKHIATVHTVETSPYNCEICQTNLKKSAL